MSDSVNSRAEAFLTRFRVLEGLLEKRYAGRETVSGSVVKEYLRDPDSEPIRADIDLCREVRNILSHNIDSDGSPVVEPSEGMLTRMDTIIDYVQRPQLAIRYGTPAEKILFAHPNDMAIDVIRHMLKNGYSHVPVAEKGRLVGVFSSDSLMVHAGRKGLNQVRDDLRIGDMKDAIVLGDDRFLFLAPDATLKNVCAAFERHQERNHRLAVVFITEDGTRKGRVLAILTAWDAMSNA